MDRRSMMLRIGALGGALGALQLALPASAELSPRSPVQALPLDDRQAKLKLVQVVFRHGARTPLTRHEELWRRTGARWDVCASAYPPVQLSLRTKDGQPVPDNPHNLKQVARVLEGGCHMGQLTVSGQLQARELGAWLRERYVHQFKLLPPSYQDSVIAARTTPYQRTIGTLAGVLTGLLGPPEPGTPAIPVVSSTAVDEILYADTKQCPHLKTFMRLGRENAQRLVRSDPDFEWVVEELERLGITRPEKSSEWHFADVHDVVVTLAAAGKPIPQGFSPRLVRAVDRLATKEFAPTVAPSITDSYGHPLIKLSLGVLLHKLVANMEKALEPSVHAALLAAKGSSAVAGPQLYLYSGHDSTIMPILSALGRDVLDSWPPFLSNIVLELWELPPGLANVPSAGPVAARHVVRVLYNREELDGLPHCRPGHHLTLEAFKSEVIGPFLISEQAITDACMVPVGHDSSRPTLTGQDDEDE